MEGRVPPDSQCTTCALKHVEMAKAAWGEFLYEEDNRRWCASHLRLAVEHLKADHREQALACREAAAIIELARDKDVREIRDRLENLQQELLKLFKEDNKDYPVALEKLKALWEMDQEHRNKAAEAPWADSGVKGLFQTAEAPESPQEAIQDVRDDLTDVIIPLGPGSVCNDDELRLLLRSLDRNAGRLGRVILATTHVPKWLDTGKVVMLPLPDPEPHCKDANLIYKTLEAIKRCGVKRFAWCADDNLFMKRTDLDKIPRLHNPRGRDMFVGDGVWSQRVLHTFDYFKGKGIDIGWNFESHAPQYFGDARGLLPAMEGVDWRTPPGLTIMTAFRCAMKDVEKGAPQDDYKETFETEASVRQARFDRLFVGYNDRAFVNGNLRNMLMAKFPRKCRFEK